MLKERSEKDMIALLQSRRSFIPRMSKAKKIRIF